MAFLCRRFTCTAGTLVTSRRGCLGQDAAKCFDAGKLAAKTGGTRSEVPSLFAQWQTSGPRTTGVEGVFPGEVQGVLTPDVCVFLEVGSSPDLFFGLVKSDFFHQIKGKGLLHQYINVYLL